MILNRFKKSWGYISGLFQVGDLLCCCNENNWDQSKINFTAKILNQSILERYSRICFHQKKPHNPKTPLRTANLITHQKLQTTITKTYHTINQYHTPSHHNKPPQLSLFSNSSVVSSSFKRSRRFVTLL